MGKGVHRHKTKNKIAIFIRKSVCGIDLLGFAHIWRGAKQHVEHQYVCFLRNKTWRFGAPGFRGNQDAGENFVLGDNWKSTRNERDIC